MPQNYVPVFIFIAVVGILIPITLVLTRLVRPNNPNRAKLSPYECGIDPVDRARGRYTVRYYIVAILFVVFDVETIFLFPWAVKFKAFGLFGLFEMLIFLGIFVDQVSMMMITLPIFMPVVQALGVDLVWFGVLFLICMQMGLLLPPHGLLLMTMKGVAPPSVTMLDIFRAVVPFLVMSVLLLVLVFLVPAVATWLPALIG